MEWQGTNRPISYCACARKRIGRIMSNFADHTLSVQHALARAQVHRIDLIYGVAVNKQSDFVMRIGRFLSNFADPTTKEEYESQLSTQYLKRLFEVG